jgi:hypothetical protein
MRDSTRVIRMIAAAAIAALALAAIAFGQAAVSTASAQSNGGPVKIVSCDSPSNGNANQSTSDGAPSTGPDTAADASDGRVGTPLWCVSGISGGHAPLPSDTADCGGGGTGASAVTDASTRGFGWVC